MFLKMVDDRKKEASTKRMHTLEKYITAMKRYGRLARDPDIYRRHARKGYGEGYAENKARVYFTALALEQGLSEDEILEIFRFAEDFDENKSRYHIRAVKRWLERKK